MRNLLFHDCGWETPDSASGLHNRGRLLAQDDDRVAIGDSRPSCSSQRQHFIHRPVRLIDGGVRVCARGGI